MIMRRRRSAGEPTQPSGEEPQPVRAEAPEGLDPITGEAALDPTLLDEQEPSPDLGAPPPPEPAPVHPEADRGVSDGSLTCTGCLRPIGTGETYVQTAVRGAQHLEPCSHQA